MSRIVGWTLCTGSTVCRVRREKVRLQSSREAGLGHACERPMSTEPNLELPENGKPAEFVKPGKKVHFCLKAGGSADTDMVDMNVHPTGHL